MPILPQDVENPSPALETHLLGQVDFGRCLALQQQLVSEVGSRDDGQIRLLLCEHPPIVTIGRGGSPDDVQLDAELLRNGRLETRWVKRGGGCLVHLPGQLAVYPIVPLRWHEMSVGEYLDRFQASILNMLDELGFVGQTRRGEFGVWGRTGQLVAFGVAVRDWVTYHGAFINVCPAPGLSRLVESDPREATRMSSLMAERRGSAKMTTVRATLVRHLSESLGCRRYHLYTGHPMLRRATLNPNP